MKTNKKLWQYFFNDVSNLYLNTTHQQEKNTATTTIKNKYKRDEKKNECIYLNCSYNKKNTQIVLNEVMKRKFK